MNKIHILRVPTGITFRKHINYYVELSNNKTNKYLNIVYNECTLCIEKTL